MGHGLGGASAILTAQNKPNNIRAIIALDPWLHILKNEKVEDGGQTSQSDE